MVWWLPGPHGLTAHHGEWAGVVPPPPHPPHHCDHHLWTSLAEPRLIRGIEPPWPSRTVLAWGWNRIGPTLYRQPVPFEPNNKDCFPMVSSRGHPLVWVQSSRSASRTRPVDDIHPSSLRLANARRHVAGAASIDSVWLLRTSPLHQSSVRVPCKSPLLESSVGVLCRSPL